MDNSFFAYLQQLELIAFFSGYPLVYAVGLYIAGDKQQRSVSKTRMVSILPFAYALVGTLYLGFELKKMYPDYSAANFEQAAQQPFLTIWALLSLLFWIPRIAKIKGLSLIHSLVFFFFIIKDIFLQLFASPANNDTINNDMKTYINSLLLNTGAFAVLLLISFLFATYNNNKRLKS